MSKVPPTKVNRKAPSKRIFYRNSDKEKAIILMAFLLTLLIAQSMLIGAMSISLWRTYRYCNHDRTQMD
jgi:hypothetical protein